MTEKPPPRRTTAADAKQRPAYAIASVDNALRLAAILQLEGTTTVTEAARRLQVAPSTAHRLLQMLVFRDLARQEPDRSYGTGPLLNLAGHSRPATVTLRRIALPHLERAARHLGETVNLSIRLGDQARFVASVEGPAATSVQTREGMAFPLHLTSGGQLLLADMDAEEVAALYDPARYTDSLDERPDMERLERDLAAVRRTGTALNSGRTEKGITAVGRAVRGDTGEVVAAVSSSIRAERIGAARLREVEVALDAAARAIGHDLDRAPRSD